MSLECGECERDLRSGHDPSCSRAGKKRASPRSHVVVGRKPAREYAEEALKNWPSNAPHFALLREGIIEIATAAAAAAEVDGRATGLTIAGAYLLDRSAQYKDGSGSKVALEDAAQLVLAGEALAAFEHGELDDLMTRVERILKGRLPKRTR